MSKYNLFSFLACNIFLLYFKNIQKFNTSNFSADFPVWTSILLICCCATISFVPSINGDFVFDDSEAVINNEDVRLTTPMWSAFYNDYWGTKLNHPNSHKSYRPLTVLSFRSEKCILNTKDTNFNEEIFNSQVKLLAERRSACGQELQTGKFVTTPGDFCSVVECF